MNIAVILAGGVGKRFVSGEPKQFTRVAGRTVLEYTVAAFEASRCIDEIAVVANSRYIEKVRGIVEAAGWKKVRKVLDGGKERYDSTLAAIRAYQGIHDANLIIHDAVRPLVSVKMIAAVAEALKTHDAVEVAVPLTDTVIENRDSSVASIPDRSHLWRVQTPQAFKMDVIAEAFRRALSDPDFTVTDDAGVVFRYMKEVPVYVVRGEESNVKLTYPDDLMLIESLLKSKYHV